MDFSEFETARGGIWRICAVIDYATKYCLAATVTPTSRGNALAVEVNLFRHTYNTLRPHQALDERTPRAAYLAVEHCD
jgi:transposase InsO family protein